MSNIALSGNASGTGTFTLASPNSNSDRTLTLPDAGGTVLTSASTANFPAGSVLQVVQGDLASTFSTTNNTATDTGLSATITPSSASNKILVFLDGHGGQSNSGRSCFYFLVRSSTTIKSADNLQAGTTDSVMPMVLMQLDSPSTTSAVTYKIQMRTDGVGTVTMVSSGTQASSLILMEIAG
jgi:hypothetical protein